MSNADNGNKERNREIARNEEVRQTTGDIRVSAWAIAPRKKCSCLQAGLASRGSGVRETMALGAGRRTSRPI
jgi:hypothetical protein